MKDEIKDKNLIIFSLLSFISFIFVCGITAEFVSNSIVALVIAVIYSFSVFIIREILETKDII